MTLLRKLRIRHALRKSIRRMRRLGVGECRLAFPDPSRSASWPMEREDAVKTAKFILRMSPLCSVVLVPAALPKEVYA